MEIVARGRRYASLRDKLIALTDRRGPNDCWPWLGSASKFSPKQSPSMYGRVNFGGLLHYAHRATYEVFVGPIAAGLTVDHTCFNTLCQNPAHLEAVSREVNSRRFQANKRLPREGRVMLSLLDRRQIASLYRSGGVSQAALGRMFGVHQSHVCRILRKAS